MENLLIFGSGFVAGFALLAFGRAHRIVTLERSLKAVKTSQQYYRGIVEQYEVGYDLERGINEIGKQVDAAAKEMGLCR